MKNISISVILQEVGAKGVMLTLGKGLLQLAAIIACVCLVRHILKRIGTTKGPGIRIGWSVDEAEARREAGLEAAPKPDEPTEE